MTEEQQSSLNRGLLYQKISNCVVWWMGKLQHVKPSPTIRGQKWARQETCEGLLFSLPLQHFISIWQVITEGLAIWSKGACGACLCSRALMIWILAFTMPTCQLLSFNFRGLTSAKKYLFPMSVSQGSFLAVRTDQKTKHTRPPFSQHVFNNTLFCFQYYCYLQRPSSTFPAATYPPSKFSLNNSYCCRKEKSALT